MIHREHSSVAYSVSVTNVKRWTQYSKIL